MQSQVDIFASQDNPKKSKYGYVVLCDQDVHVANPFAWYPRSIFTTEEIPEKWLDSILDYTSRLKSLGTFERMPGKNFSLFGKIDDGIPKTFILIFNIICSNIMNYFSFFCLKGVCQELRDAKINAINAEYNSMRSALLSQAATLTTLVTKYPYRMISLNSIKEVSVTQQI